MEWSDYKPTEPGWRWYEDPEYGPAPVYVDWALHWTGEGLQEQKQVLEVEHCCGRDQVLLGTPVSKLEGRWYPLAEPPTDE